METNRFALRDHYVARVLGDEVVFAHTSEDRIVVLKGHVGVDLWGCVADGTDVAGSIERLACRWEVEAGALRSVVEETLAALRAEGVVVDVADSPSATLPAVLEEARRRTDFQRPTVAAFHLADLVPDDLVVQGATPTGNSMDQSQSGGLCLGSGGRCRVNPICP